MSKSIVSEFFPFVRGYTFKQLIFQRANMHLIEELHKETYVSVGIFDDKNISKILVSKLEEAAKQAREDIDEDWKQAKQEKMKSVKNDNVICRRCNLPGHIATNCHVKLDKQKTEQKMEKKIEPKIEREREEKVDLLSPKEMAKTVKKEVNQCSNCGGDSHFSKDCRGKNKSEIVCRKCKQIGHFAKLCPKNKN